MNPINNEQNILNIIKYAPIILVVILSFIFTNIFITQKKEILLQDKIQLEEKYINENKKRVKFLTDRIYAYIQEEKQNTEAELKAVIKAKVYEAHRIATSIYNIESKYNKDNNIQNDKHILESVKAALSSVTFNDGRGYIFMDDVNGIKLLNPIKEIEGKNYLNFKDARGYQFVKNIVKTIKNKTEAYDKYYWYKGQDKQTAHEKISFYKYFAPFNAAIGMGDYIEDFEKNLKKKILAKINNMKFENYEHIFIYDLKGNVLSYPQQDLIGTNRYESKTANGDYTLKNILNFVEKNKQGFQTYSASVKLNKNLQSNEKISYVKLFEDWGWMIGSGFFLEGLEHELQEREELLIKSNQEVITNIITISIAITLLLIAFSFYISKVIEQMFYKYKLNIQREIGKTLEKEKLLLQQSKMASMGEMIGSIAHQWKQPLGMVSISSGVLRLAKQEEGLISEEKQKEALDNVDFAIKNLTQTIDDFRNFFDPNKTKNFFKISMAFHDTLKLINSELKNSEVTVIENIEDIEIYGSQNELQQTLINLIKNAKEELVKKDSDEKKYIFLESSVENENAIIKVRDNASGISEENMQKIFQAYFTTKEEKGGTGIGLYMSRQIIEESMKGTLEVHNVQYEYENAKYNCAEFIITIPIDYREIKEN